jgi:hypothetical protein
VGVFDSTGTAICSFDFRAWRSLPADEPTEMDVRWADVSNEILYVSLSHFTYAKTTKGKNAYIAAITIPGGEVRWLSNALVSNSANFLIRDGVIATGYGFTAEPDFVYLLDAGSGEILQTAKVKSGPEWFGFKNGTLHVRCYDTDYEFDWNREPRAGAH